MANHLNVCQTPSDSTAKLHSIDSLKIKSINLFLSYTYTTTRIRLHIRLLYIYSHLIGRFLIADKIVIVPLSVFHRIRLINVFGLSFNLFGCRFGDFLDFIRFRYVIVIGGMMIIGGRMLNGKHCIQHIVEAKHHFVAIFLKSFDAKGTNCTRKSKYFRVDPCRSNGNGFARMFVGCFVHDFLDNALKRKEMLQNVLIELCTLAIENF